MKRKKFLKWLRQEANKLPMEQYVANHKLTNPTFVKAEEDEKEDLTKTDGQGNEVRLKLVNVYQEPHEVNHYRRLKRGFNSKGFQFINQYFEKRGFTNQKQINGESITTEEQTTV